MTKTFATLKDLKVGKHVIIDDEPCRIVEVQTSAPGKHGAAKMRVAAIGIFTNSKKTLLKPADAEVEVPIIERKTGQIVSVQGESAQIMDLQTYETFEITMPEELRAGAEAGKEVEYIETMGRRMITRIR
ncbi:MAG: translation initiation factor IF-5A [Candidatus Micrarchaeia archaeon]